MRSASWVRLVTVPRRGQLVTAVHRSQEPDVHLAACYEAGTEQPGRQRRDVRRRHHALGDGRAESLGVGPVLVGVDRVRSYTGVRVDLPLGDQPGAARHLQTHVDGAVSAGGGPDGRIVIGKVGFGRRAGSGCGCGLGSEQHLHESAAGEGGVRPHRRCGTRSPCRACRGAGTCPRLVRWCGHGSRDGPVARSRTPSGHADRQVRRTGCGAGTAPGWRAASGVRPVGRTGLARRTGRRSRRP